MAGTLKLDLALYREMAAFSSFGFDESTQELLRRGAALTEMLKQQQYRPLSSEVQVFVLFNGIRERIAAPKQIRFYEYQVVPNLAYGIKNNNTLRSLRNIPVSKTCLYFELFATTERLLLSNQASNSPGGLRASTQKYALENRIKYTADPFCTFFGLLGRPHKTHLFSASFLVLMIAFKYEITTQRKLKETDKLFNVLAAFNIGG